MLDVKNPNLGGIVSNQTYNFCQSRGDSFLICKYPLQGESGKTGSFSTFAGFKKPSAQPQAASFSFLSNLSTVTVVPKPTNGVSLKTTMAMFQTSETRTDGGEKNKNLDEYYSKLKGLNESVANFIKSHVDKNPFINLQPVFADYEKYIDKLEKLREHLLKDSKTVVAESDKSVSKLEEKATPSGLFVFKPAPRNSIESVKAQHSNTETEKSDSSRTTSQFSFGTSLFSGSKTETTAFCSFGGPGSAPYPFPSTSKSGKGEENNEDDDDNEEPPKPEFTPVVEEGHVYTSRCKVFVKKDGSFADRGVGNLFLKPIPDSVKMQLIVRADTSLGNLLCNFILSENTPTKRLGKKDVMLVCVPTPDAKPPPVPLLLRAKSSEEADQLLETLEKYKK